MPNAELYQLSLNWPSLVFPVIGTDQEKGSERTDVDRLYGTAFSIGDGYFLTAGHVVEGARKSESFGLGYRVDGENTARVAYAGDSEINTELDLGIIEPNEGVPRQVSPLPWSMESPNMGRDVLTVGFPHGLDREQAAFRTRAFKGHLVSVEFGGDRSNLPQHFELSFPCPRQISGAPLLSRRSNVRGAPPPVVGIILGNSESGVRVGGYTEEISDEDGDVRRHTVKKDSVVLFGIALSATSVREFHSDLLGRSVIEHLKAQE